MRIFRIPLEILPERYTEQWAQWFPNEMERCGFSYNEIPGEPLSSKVETGKVLDASGTMHFKFSQMKRISEMFKKGMVKDKDAFFIDDIQFPGVWAIKYMAHMYGIKVFLFGYLHASSYTSEDFAEPMSPFMKSIEKSWIFTYDKIFVGTNYHKSSFIEKRFPAAYKRQAKKMLYVSGGPWNVWTVQMLTYKSPLFEQGKRNRIIFSSRFDIEKRPNVFLKLADFMYNILGMKDIEFLITTSRNKLTDDKNLLNMLDRAYNKIPTLEVMMGIDKQSYYAHLSQSKLMVSTTIEENFGYCVVESLSLNTPVLVPNNYSHPEILGDLVTAQNVMMYDIEWSDYRNDFDLPSDYTGWNDKRIVDLAGKVVYSLNFFNNYDNLYEPMIKYNKSIENMCTVMKTIIKNG